MIGPGGKAANLRNRIILMLAVRYPSPIRRREVVELLWPEVGREEGANRLRVGLSRLKSKIPLVIENEEIGLAQDLVEVDLYEAISSLDRIRDEPDSDREWNLILNLVPALRQRLLPNVEDAWLMEVQASWALAATEALARFCTSALEREDFESLLIGAETGLIHLPFDEEFWDWKLRAMARLGEVPAAIREFSLAQKRAEAEGCEIGSNVQRFAAELAADPKGYTSEFAIPPSDTDVLYRCFARAVESEPELIQSILASRSFRPEIFRSPEKSLKLLRWALQEPAQSSEARERCQVRVITALSFLHLDEEVVKEVENFLKQDIGDNRRRIALLNGSMALFGLGRHHEAINAALEASRIAESTGWPYDAWQCRCQVAIFELLLGNAEKAIDVFQGGLTFFSANPVAGTEQDRALIEAHLGYAKFLIGDVETARSILNQADSLARDLGFSVVVAQSSMWLGRVYCHLGQPEIARPALLRGLKASYRQSSIRMSINALGEAAEALLDLRVDDANKVLSDWRYLFEDAGFVRVYADERRHRLLQGTNRNKPTHLIDAYRFAISQVRKLSSN